MADEQSDIQQAKEPDVAELAGESVEKVPVNIGLHSTGGEEDSSS